MNEGTPRAMITPSRFDRPRTDSAVVTDDDSANRPDEVPHPAPPRPIPGPLGTVHRDIIGESPECIEINGLEDAVKLAVCP